jgi:uncharacterized protein (UPF0261 family)
MAKTVVIVGALDTKGNEFLFAKEVIEKQGLKTLIIDFGCMKEPAFKPDIDHFAVAKAGGSELAPLQTVEKKDEAMQVMSNGLAVIVRKLYDEGKLDGILGMGGSGGTSIATNAMRSLPVGVPKVMLSTLGGGNVSVYSGTKDITFMPSIVDVAGFNSISRKIYANAANAVAGMVKGEVPASGEMKPLITASMFGNTTTCVNAAREILEKEGYEVLIFHATGTGGKTMESLIADGYIAANLDITTTELADEVCRGVFSAGPDRLFAAARAGIPTLLCPGCVDMANYNGMDTVPPEFHSRNLYKWNPNVTLMRTNIEENIKMGEWIAKAANESKGPVAIIIPLKGVSQLDSEGNLYWDPPADKACYDTIKKNLKPGIPVVELDNNINDPEFSSKAAQMLLDMLKKK